MDREHALRILEHRGWTVTPGGCWDAWGTPNNSGYIMTTVGKERWSKHRLAYTLWVGDIPEGHVVRHEVCDNPICINPAHLSTGTYKQNSEDMVRKNRGQHGERHWNTRLSPETVIEIYRAAHSKSGLNQIQIGKFFGVSQMTVSEIKRKRKWRRLLEDAEARGII